MVRVCAFPNCDSKMSRHTPRSFHRLPLSNRGRLRLWLAVLQMDTNTPVQTLRLADHRVCSDHFDRDDYCQPKRRRHFIPKHFFLKKDAVPRVKRPAAAAAHTVEVMLLLWLKLCDSSHQHTFMNTCTNNLTLTH